MSAVTLPQKAGFVPTVQEWDQLVRIAENLAAQVVQRDAESLKATFDAHEKINQLSGDLYGAQMALAQAQAERAAARSALENERELRKYYQGNSDVDNPLSYALAVGQLAAARAEVARLTAAAERLLKMHTRPDGSTGSDTSMVEGALMDLRAAMRQPAPAPAKGQE